MIYDRLVHLNTIWVKFKGQGHGENVPKMVGLTSHAAFLVCLTCWFVLLLCCLFGSVLICYAI